MQRHRFYSSPVKSTTIILDPAESHHLSRVLRLGEGARVFVFDGRGNEWECEVSRLSRSAVELKLLGKMEDPVESPLNLTLAPALIKGDKFDWVVQKATELGVTRILPLISEHSELRRAADRSAQRLERWRRIAGEAIKQCGRRTLVEIAEPVHFEDYCARAGRKNDLIFSERGGLNLRELGELGMRSVGEVSLFVAPEGGWSAGELLLAEKSGFHPVHLGPRILRAETAAIAAVTLAQHLFGDLK